MVSAALTLWGKNMRKMRVHPEEVFGMLITPVLWVGMFGLGMGSLLDAGSAGGVDGYMTFILPGIMALTVLGAAVGAGSVWLFERLQGTVKEYLAAPIPRVSILLGNGGYVVTQALIQSAVILLVGVLLGASLSGGALDWLAAVSLLMLFGFGFAGIALAAASSIDDMGGYHMMIMLLQLPMLFLSNALYPLEALPRWMAIGAQLNPVTYLVAGLRQTTLQVASGPTAAEPLSLWLCFAVVGAFAAFGIALAVRAFRKSLG
jgi:ABC-2 type transport system permease protein